jgi:hypothetical protein
MGGKIGFCMRQHLWGLFGICTLGELLAYEKPEKNRGSFLTKSVAYT